MTPTAGTTNLKVGNREAYSTGRQVKARAEPLHVFKGDSAREWMAKQTCEKSGNALEITTPGPSLGRLLLQLAGFGFFLLIVAEVVL